MSNNNFNSNQETEIVIQSEESYGKRINEIDIDVCDSQNDEITFSRHEKSDTTYQVHHESTEAILMKHMIKNILLILNQRNTDSEDVLLHLSPKSIEILRSWVKDNDSPYNSIDAFDAIKDSFYLFKNPNAFFETSNLSYFQNIQYIKEFLAIALFMTAIIYLIKLLDIDLKNFLLKITIFLFVISIPWNWLLLYKKAIAKKQSALIASIPEECQKQNLTFGIWISSLFTIQTKDPCHKHYESVLVDPLWEISPTQALSETIIRFFVQPAENIGSAISLSIRSMLEHLPVQMWPIALIFLFAVIFFILIATFQYSCTCPIFGGIEPFGEKKLLQLNERLRTIEKENSRLILKFESFQSQLILSEASKDVNTIDCPDCRSLTCQNEA